MTTATTRTWKPKICQECGVTFGPTSSRQKYCKACGRRGSGVCEQCGKQFRRTANTTGRYCSSECWYLANTGVDKRKRPCEVCGELFKPHQHLQRTCSRRCWGILRRKERPREIVVRQCAVCGAEFEPKGGRQSTCSPACGSKFRWGKAFPIGSRRINRDGYYVVKVARDHPGAPVGGWMLEHRLIMQDLLGRTLKEHETIHHKNGDKCDNHPGNLELRVGHHGPGQRLEDLVDAAMVQPEVMVLDGTTREQLRRALERVLK